MRSSTSIRGNPRPLPSPGRTAGFSLIELMVVITIAAVIMGLAIPNLTQFVRNNRMTAAANDMLAGIHMARTEAVKRRTPTTMCFTANPNDPTPICANGGRGWIVFSDNDADFAFDAGETILLRHDPLPAAFTSMKKTPADTQGIIFTRSGFARTTAIPLTGVVLCDARNNVAAGGPLNSAARAVVVAATGRPQVNRSVAEITDAGNCP